MLFTAISDDGYTAKASLELSIEPSAIVKVHQIRGRKWYVQQNIEHGLFGWIPSKYLRQLNDGEDTVNGTVCVKHEPEPNTSELQQRFQPLSSMAVKSQSGVASSNFVTLPTWQQTSLWKQPGY